MCIQKLISLFQKKKKPPPPTDFSLDTATAVKEPENDKKIYTMQDQQPDKAPFPADEPLILFVAEFLTRRLNQLVAGEYGGSKPPFVPDWTGCGYTLSENFSHFVNALDEQLREKALMDSLLAGPDTSEEELLKNHPGMKIFRDEIVASEQKMKAKRQRPRSALLNDEKWVLLISLIPHVYPHFYDEIVLHHLKRPGEYPQIGLIRGREFRGYYPTGETVLFLLAGNDFDRRMEIHRLFQADQYFSKKQLIWLEEPGKDEPLMSGRLVIAQDHLDQILFGEAVPPEFSMNFPAKQIETQLSWNDLVINSELEEQIGMILSWVFYNDELMMSMGMNKRIKKGFRSLFYGPPGTGKTLTASLLGNITGKPVYRIDLSMVVSKYIGETEKNLEQLFARAEDKGWILFFDEADAIFGKRTGIRDAHDKYANQEVSYMLQRIEDYNGLVIMATNMKSNIDDSFIRRFNSMLKFPLPDEEHRAMIWRRSLPSNVPWKKQRPEAPFQVAEGKQIDIPEQVKKYELSGGNIVNVIQYAALKATEVYNEKKQSPAPVLLAAEAIGSGCDEPGQISDESSTEPQLTIYLSDVLDGIRRELIKEGKPFKI